ncbi:catabolite control protein A, partial [Streptococcus suis]
GEDNHSKVLFAAIKKGLYDHGIEVHERVVYESKYKYEEGYSLADRILNAGAPAAYVAEAEFAAGLLKCVSDLGVMVPDD